MTLDEYIDRLTRHDWNYDFHDSYQKWKAGNDNFYQLLRYRDDLDPDHSIWNAHAGWRHKSNG